MAVEDMRTLFMPTVRPESDAARAGGLKGKSASNSWNGLTFLGLVRLIHLLPVGIPFITTLKRAKFDNPRLGAGPSHAPLNFPASFPLGGFPADFHDYLAMSAGPPGLCCLFPCMRLTS
jgi:hypothetical protein